MRNIVTDDQDKIERFVAKGIGYGAHTKFSAIGLEKDGELIAGVVFSDYNTSNITAAIHGVGNWLNKEFLWYMFYYPFYQAGVGRITVTIESNNAKSHRLATRLGFEFEATLQRAGRFGDLHVYRMFREDCKWLKESKDVLVKTSTSNKNGDGTNPSALGVML